MANVVGKFCVVLFFRFPKECFSTTCVQGPDVNISPEAARGQLTAELKAAGPLALQHNVLDPLGEEQGLPLPPAGQAEKMKPCMDGQNEARLVRAEGEGEERVLTPASRCMTRR